MGSPKSDHIARQQFRKKLEKWGMDPKEIDLCVQQVKFRQRLKNSGVLEKDAPLCTRAEYVRYLRKQSGANGAVLHFGEDYESPSDSGYKPSTRDPLLHGPGRVSGLAAKVVSNGKTITKWQYNESRGSDV